ncbi:MAG: thioredoxin [Candidatus Saccharimonas sp.]
MALYNITTKQEFEDRVLHSSKVVLVDFWAEWCPPCRAMAPSLHNIGDKHDDIIDIVKVDIEATAENAGLATEYQVRSIPNMVVFKGGKEVDRIIGLTPEVALVDQLKKHA